MMMSSSLPNSRRPSYGDLRRTCLSRQRSTQSFTSMLTYLDDSPKNRRAIRGSLPSSKDNYSGRSILSAMERFVKSVNNMDDTVLVPSRLKDLSSEEAVDAPADVTKADLYLFFNTLNEEKNELLWGPDTDDLSETISRSSSYSSLEGTLNEKLIRRDSSGSLGSAGSSSLEDSDSEDSSDGNDSVHLAAAFRYHLRGLSTIFHQLADTADYLTERYKKEVEV